jgi:MFS family permease
LVIGVQLSLNAYITNYYPTAIRGTGVGWSQVVGRLGSLSGPLVGGALVSQGMAPHQLFQVSSLAPLLACVFLLLFAKLSHRRPSDRWLWSRLMGPEQPKPSTISRSRPSTAPSSVMRAPFLSAAPILATSDLVSVLPLNAAKSITRSHHLVFRRLSRPPTPIEITVIWLRRLDNQPLHAKLRDVVSRATNDLRDK